MIVPITDIAPGSRVLIAGCGGGYDIVAAGFPIGRALEQRGHHVVYSSYTFSRLRRIEGCDKLADSFVRIDRSSTLADTYFPEKHLCEWYHANTGEDRSVYLYAGQGVKPLVGVLDQIAATEGVDWLFVVDGGCDGILRGDEYDLGTPEIDAISVVAGSLSSIPHRVYVASAFGTEGPGKTVSHAEVLERMAEATATGDMLGVASIHNDAAVTHDYLSLFEFLIERTSRGNTGTIMGSIVEGLRGRFGDTAFNSKTVLSPV